MGNDNPFNLVVVKQFTAAWTWRSCDCSAPEMSYTWLKKVNPKKRTRTWIEWAAHVSPPRERREAGATGGRGLLVNALFDAPRK